MDVSTGDSGATFDSPPCASWRELDILCPCPLMCPVAKVVIARRSAVVEDVSARGSPACEDD